MRSRPIAAQALAVCLVLAIPRLMSAQSSAVKPDSTTSPPSAKPVSAPYVHTTDSWFGEDKVKHFFIAGFAESLAFAGLEAVGSSRSSALGGAVGFAAALSVGREIHDRRTKGLFSIRDLAWDAIGAGAAFIVLAKAQR